MIDLADRSSTEAIPHPKGASELPPPSPTTVNSEKSVTP